MTIELSEIGPALVSRAAEGEGDAVAAIVRALERPFYNLALRMLHDPRDAEDAAQESLIRVVTRLAQYRGEAQFSTWAWRIAVRRILDVKARRPPVSFAQFEADLAEGRDDHAVERAEDAVLHRQLKTMCGRAALQCLDDDHRIAFILGEILEVASPEAAEIVDCDPAAFRKRLSRARAALSEFLTRQCGVVNEAAPCACHRRLARAQKLGRVRPDAVDAVAGDLVELRRKLAVLPIADRVAASYRSDPDATSRRDFVAAVRALFGHFAAS
jgi:RNA polymerase sigma factor (sigma-70 family)